MKKFRVTYVYSCYEAFEVEANDEDHASTIVSDSPRLKPDDANALEFAEEIIEEIIEGVND